MQETASATIVNSSFIGAKDHSQGAAIESVGTLLIKQCMFKKNIAGYLCDDRAVAGGAIYIRGKSHCTIISSTITENEATSGGGIYNENSRLILHDVLLYGNIGARQAADLQNCGELEITYCNDDMAQTYNLEGQTPLGW